MHNTISIYRCRDWSYACYDCFMLSLTRVTPPYILLRGVMHVVIVACNYPLSAYTNCNSSLW